LKFSFQAQFRICFIFGGTVNAGSFDRNSFDGGGTVRLLPSGLSLKKVFPSDLPARIIYATYPDVAMFFLL